MFKQIQSFFTSLNSRRAELLNLGYNSAIAAIAVGFLLASLPIDAMAQAAAFDVPFVSGMGCAVANWMKGPLAILIFVIVCISVLVIGLMTKMDWARMITVAVVFGIIQGLVTLLLSSGRIQLPACLSA